jgi:general secretion pathway protein G
VRRAVLAGIVAVLAMAALAQEKQPTVQETEEQKKTLQALKSHSLGIFCGGTTVRSLLDSLLDDTGLSYVVDPSMPKSEDFEFDASGTMEELLKQALEPRGLDYLIRKDGVIFVSTKKRIEELKHGKNEEKPDLKPGEMLFLLKDGTKIKGKIDIEKWNLSTAYGDLVIPSSDIRVIRPGKKPEETAERDEVETVRFTAAGQLDIDKLEVDTGKGKLAIPVSDIKEILFPGVKPVKPLDKEILARTKADFKSMQDAIEIYKMDTGAYPAKLDDLMTNSGVAGWSGPYLKRPPLDAWESPYIYKELDKGPLPYELKTCGADGKLGGEGENRDLTNLDLLKEK